MPRSSMIRASPRIVSGEFTEAWPMKFSDDSVSEARSGFRSPSRARTSARFSSSDQVRPLVLTLITTSGAASRTAPTMRAYTSRSHVGSPSASRACRCTEVIPISSSRRDVPGDLLGRQRDVRGHGPGRHHPGRGEHDRDRLVEGRQQCGQRSSSTGSITLV